ncbi:MAG TPA: VCBS repeat-containing protein, partial [Verrucomicrobiae bacterium]|nr:VCBS repeat-containing protein [Verrucomicrobiae bacterium]
MKKLRSTAEMASIYREMAYMSLRTRPLFQIPQTIKLCSHVGILLATFWSASCIAYAQTSNASTDPDFSNVNDILEGRRTLLSINDIVVGGLVMKTSDGTKVNPSDMYQLPGFNPQGAGPETLARMFETATDTLVYTNGQTIYAVDPVSQQAVSLQLNGVGVNEFNGADMATGDFSGNGLGEVVIASASGVRLVAPNGTNLSQGLKVGPAWKPADYKGGNSDLGLAVGDFLGDGRREIAVTWGNTALNQTWLNILTVDPNTLALTSHSQYLLVFHGANFQIGISLAAGHFGSTTHDQLAVAVYAFKNPGIPRFVHMRTLEIDSDLQPIQQQDYMTKLPSGGEVVIRTGRFNPLSPYDQVAFKYNPSPGNVQLGIVSFDTTLKVNFPKTLFKAAGINCSQGLSVGNFARTEPVPTNPSQTQTSLKLQLAFTSSDCSSKIAVEVYNVDPSQTAGADFTISQILGGQLAGQDQYFGLPLVAGDIQGRSLLLGDPTKVVIADTAQPSVIQAMPPMHVDFIPPAGGSQPEVLNVSAIPSGFYTVYEKTSSEEKESSTTNTTSWGFGAMQSAEASVEIGSVGNGLGARAGAAFRAAQNLNQVIETEIGSYQGKSFTATSQTTSADHVWFSENRFNIYIYPVIGQTVCPAATPNCADSEKVPLTIQFSGPDNTVYRDEPADILPWYQPPWEPFNVFSYPATYAQLQAMVPAGLQKLSQDNTWSTTGSVRTQETTWTQGATNGSSVSFDQNYSFETELSVAGACCGGIVNGSFSAQLNLSGSTGFNDLNKAVARIGKSTGIGINIPGTFLTPITYNYPVTPYIFGELPPPGKGDNTPLQGDIQTSGILRTAFVAD